MSLNDCDRGSVGSESSASILSRTSTVESESCRRCSNESAELKKIEMAHILRMGADRRSSCQEAPIHTRSSSSQNWRRSSIVLLGGINRCLSSPDAPKFSVSFLQRAGRNVDDGKIALGKTLLERMDFDTASFSGDELEELVLEIFLLLRLNEHVGIPVVKLKLFIARVREHMFENPYHNWTHVADVVQAAFALGLSTGLLHRLTPLQQFALLVSALCHDLEHPGVNNLALVKSKPELSQLYGECSTLEKHHSLRAFSLMLHHEVDLLGGLDAPTYYSFRDIVTRIIMATDMTRHRDYCAKVEQLAVPSPEGVVVEMEVLIKCADTANVLRPMHCAKRWAVRVGEEFFAQGDLERSMGLKVTPAFDRRTQSVVSLQKSFIDVCIGPFFDSVGRAYPGAADALRQVWRNRKEWDGIDDQILRKELKASV